MRHDLFWALLITCIGSQAVAEDLFVISPYEEDAKNVLLVVVRTDDPVSWVDAESQAELMGTTLLAPWSAPSSAALNALANTIGPWECVGPWLGVLRPGSFDAIEMGWIDPRGFPITFTDWSADAPMGAHVLRWSVALDARNGQAAGWVNILPDPDSGPDVHGWACALPYDSPDCNNDGVPNIIEIVIGGAEDTNNDDVPDGCIEISADFNGDGHIDGLDLGALLTYWGPCNPNLPCVADLNRDGQVNGNDLGLFFVQWTG